MGLAGNLAAGLMGGYRGYEAGEEKKRRDMEAERQEASRQQNEKFRQLQMDIMARNQEDAKRERQAKSMFIQNMMGHVPADNVGPSPSPFTGMTPDQLSYLDPGLVTTDFRTPAQKEEQSLKHAEAIAEINRRYSAAGKPAPFALLENEQGQQRWTRKGDPISEGWKVVSQSGTTINVGGAVKPVPTEKVRLYSLAKSGLESIGRAEKLFFDNQGRYDANLAKVLSLPDAAAASGALGERGSQAFNAIFGAIKDKLRIESGAAVPRDEVLQEMQRFAPGPFDSPETARIKLDSLKRTLISLKRTSSRGLNLEEDEPTKVDQPAKTEKPAGADLVWNLETGRAE